MLGMTLVGWAQTAPPMPSSPPNISGMWARTGGAGISAFPGDPNGLKGLKPPMTPWGEAKFNSHIPALGIRGSTHPNDTTTFKCLPPGVPRIYREPGSMQIFQGPGLVAQLFEFNHLIRVIYTDGRKHPEDVKDFPTWMGHSIGHWEGDTLVVETVGQNDKTWIDRVGNPHSESLRVLERIRRVDANSMQIDITIDDPVAYKEPWKTPQITYRLDPTAEFVEQICEDKGDYDEVLENLTKPVAQ